MNKIFCKFILITTPSWLIFLYLFLFPCKVFNDGQTTKSFFRPNKIPNYDIILKTVYFSWNDACIFELKISL